MKNSALTFFSLLPSANESIAFLSAFSPSFPPVITNRAIPIRLFFLFLPK